MRARRPRARPVLDVDALLTDPSTELVLCCGSGGVGKTTTAAALAVRAADAGRRVAVLTVDPARRLAQALGVDGAVGEDGGGGQDGGQDGAGAPRRVPGVGAASGGSLDALVLDVRRTLDDLVDAAVPADRARAIRANPLYEAMASSFSGTTEYMAMERLGQLRGRLRGQVRAGAGEGSGDGDQPWDLLVVDTPPSRSALDFLDAPRRLSSFLDGRLVRVLTRPVRAGSTGPLRVVGAVTGGLAGGVAGGVAGALDRILGARFLRDVEAFLAGLDSVFGGFRRRAEATYAALADDGTAFLVVAAPEPDALAEAGYFVDRLAGEGLRLAGLVLNRVAPASEPDVGAAEALAAAARAPATGAGPLTAALLRLHADVQRGRAAQERAVAAALADRPDLPVAVAPAQPGDVADLPSLRALGAALAAGAASDLRR